jgi:dihydrofolate reductase
VGIKAWAGEDERNLEFFKRSVTGLGASIAGRGTYNDSIRYWGANGPSGAQRQPLIVVTHEEPAEVPPDSVYTFVTDGIESALGQARAAAEGKDVAIMGGANIAQQYIAAGLVDEIQIHLVPTCSETACGSSSTSATSRSSSSGSRSWTPTPRRTCATGSGRRLSDSTR